MPHTATKAYATTMVMEPHVCGKAWQVTSKPTKSPKKSGIDEKTKATPVKMHPLREGARIPGHAAKAAIAMVPGKAVVAKVQKPAVAKVQKAALL